ncbi:MAG: YicC family protein [Deltaproteobacteria bacterium]|nr:YicC family protein [Deltaproteobacteria bacterium]
MSIASMTGFGRSVVRTDAIEIECEIRSINSRFLDLSFRLPQQYSAAETSLSKIVRETIRRGRVEISVRRNALTNLPVGIQFDQVLFERSLGEMKSALQAQGVLDPSTLSALVGVLFQRREVLDFVGVSADSDSETATLEKAVTEAVADLRRMRLVEGAALESELSQILARLTAHADHAKAVTVSEVPAIQKRLRERVDKLLAGVSLDENRFAQETAILAERADVTEELTRLDSHLTQLAECLRTGESGKKMEFLLQEIGREVNTTGSKSQSSDLSRIAVEMKSELEKFREQVQNVE